MTGDGDDAGDRVLGRLSRGGVRYQTMTFFSTQRFSRVPGHQSGCPTPRGGFWGGLATFSAFLEGLWWKIAYVEKCRNFDGFRYLKTVPRGGGGGQGVGQGRTAARTALAVLLRGSCLNLGSPHHNTNGGFALCVMLSSGNSRVLLPSMFSKFSPLCSN